MQGLFSVLGIKVPFSELDGATFTSRVWRVVETVREAAVLASPQLRGPHVQIMDAT